MIVFDIIV